MSEIRATTISDETGNGPIALTKQSAAKAWCFFNTSSSTSITGSFNVSSLTDLGTGYTKITITNAMASASDFSMQCTSNNFQAHNASTPTASEFWFYSSTATGTANDGTRNYFTLHGDLA